MKRVLARLCLIVGGLGAIGAADSQPEPSGPDFTEVIQQTALELPLLSDNLIRETIKLSPAESDAIGSEFARFKAEIADLRAKHHDDLVAIARDAREAQRRLAATGGNTAPGDIENVYRRHESFYREFLAVQQKHRHTVIAILTPEHQVRWQAVAIHDNLSRWLPTAVTLSDEQKLKSDAICEDAANKVLKLDDSHRARDFADLCQAVQQRVHDEVLTPEQRQHCFVEMMEAQLRKAASRPADGSGR
jgi:Asp-tRNA(Asn)/Glu-tRNA(Gln) amidotransferase A subunit family amidase